MRNIEAGCRAAVIVLLLAALRLGAQQAPTAAPLSPTNPQPAISETAAPVSHPSTYLLGPGDRIIIQGPEMEEITNTPYPVGPDGYVELPLLGQVKAAGLTIDGFEAELTRAASQYIRNPQLAASIVEFHSQPISVVGAVTKPGTLQLQGRKTLMEVLSTVGGFQADAGNTLIITRELQWGALPLPNTTTDPSGKHSVAEISIPELIQEKTPGLNIPMMPNDLITVPVSGTIYVVGDVSMPGGFLLGEHKDMTVLQALALAQGISTTSDAKHSEIIHHPANSAAHTETQVDVKKLLAGKLPDVPLEAGDILFVPGSVSKKAGVKTADAAIEAASLLIIFRL